VRELVFALTFHGAARAKPGSTTIRQARTSAPSQTLRTTLADGAIHALVEPASGGRAVLESEVERFPDGSFVEWGTITYGDVGVVSFETVGRGVVGDSPLGGWKSGAVVWTVTGGTGALAGARGLITSNFAVSDRGEVVDNHFVRLYVPS
jgi:hypothetical protein